MQQAAILEAFADLCDRNVRRNDALCGGEANPIEGMKR